MGFTANQTMYAIYIIGQVEWRVQYRARHCPITKDITTMAASTHTPHMHLSQFGSDDRPSWIDDYNADMRIIDAASKTAYNYFTWSGDEEIELRVQVPDAYPIPITNSWETGGIGDNDVISAIWGDTIRINQDGTYLIWSTVNISAFHPVRGNISTALSLMYTQDGTWEDPAKINTVHGGFVTPIKTGNTGPQQMVQSLSLQPTAVRLQAGAAFMLNVQTEIDGTTGDTGFIRANAKESSTGIIKIR